MFHFHAMTAVLLGLLGFTLWRGKASLRAWPWRARGYAALAGLCILALLCLASPAVWGWQALGAAIGLVTATFSVRLEGIRRIWGVRPSSMLHAGWLLPIAVRLGWDLAMGGKPVIQMDPWLAVLQYPVCVHFAYVSAYRARLSASVTEQLPVASLTLAGTSAAGDRPSHEGAE